ncbi:phage GP46 family protein [Desulfovibrio sp. OttesenSCG-928-G15]|nr:phage GP46 family protein [Desulfovibrio sp. OttesenSCG-928-G15]
MSDTALDPYTGDYTGQRTGDLSNAVYMRLFTPLGSYWADPSIGSRLHLLARSKDLPNVRVLAKAYADEALAPLVRDGRAEKVTVDVQELAPDDTGAGRMLLLIDIVDLTGKTRTYSYPYKVI